ncbi:MAG: NAD-dependent epimerase/dehydratase family protein [Candidatus Caenarcaniphilales bacterium]|nr:NAD-dependent epimerase/dehydratase family protein [Candidatus Caenarcaniphilales bacterium]
MKKILVFGGNKFLGKNIIEQIQIKMPSAQIYSLTRSGIQEDKVKENKNLKYLKCDRTSPSELEKTLRDLGTDKFDFVFDASAYQPEVLEPSVNVLKKRVGTSGTWAFVSSAGVYAKTERFPIEADFPKVNSQPQPTPHWGKLQCEELLKSQAGLHTFCIRPFYIYGPENTFDRESFFFRSLESGKDILVPDDGKALLQFASVRDVASLFVDLALLSKEQTQHKAFHAADKTVHTINSFIQTCAKVVGKEAKLKYFSVEEAKKEGFQLRDIFPLRAEHYFGDVQDLENLGLQASNDLEQGLRKTYDWFKQNRDLYPKHFMTEAGERFLLALK